jgi:hypothetical protein
MSVGESIWGMFQGGPPVQGPNPPRGRAFGDFATQPSGASQIQDWYNRRQEKLDEERRARKAQGRLF